MILLSNLDRPWCTSTLDSCAATVANTASAPLLLLLLLLLLLQHDGASSTKKGSQTQQHALVMISGTPKKCRRRACSIGVWFHLSIPTGDLSGDALIAGDRRKTKTKTSRVSSPYVARGGCRYACCNIQLYDT